MSKLSIKHSPESGVMHIEGLHVGMTQYKRSAITGLVFLVDSIYNIASIPDRPLPTINGEPVPLDEIETGQNQNEGAMKVLELFKQRYIVPTEPLNPPLLNLAEPTSEPTEPDSPGLVMIQNIIDTVKADPKFDPHSSDAIKEVTIARSIEQIETITNLLDLLKLAGYSDKFFDRIPGKIKSGAIADSITYDEFMEVIGQMRCYPYDLSGIIGRDKKAELSKHNKQNVILNNCEHCPLGLLLRGRAICSHFLDLATKRMEPSEARNHIQITRRPQTSQPTNRQQPRLGFHMGRRQRRR